MISDIEKTIKEYLPQVIHLSLATSHENKPWVCEVHYVYDDNLNLYFRSLPSTRHCKEIADNPNIAGNIVRQHELTEKPRGIYFEGVAEQLNNVDENNIAYKLYCKRFGTNQSILEDAQKKDGHKFYKISVTKFYIFDAVESKPSQKYELDWSK